MRDEEGRVLYPLSVAGMIAGIVALYATGLLVSVRWPPVAVPSAIRLDKRKSNP